MSSPAFQFYPKEFMLATQSWSVEEVGIYIKLLCFQWDNGSLPNDLKRLSRIAGLEYDLFEKAWVLVGLKFLCGFDGFLRNQRLELVRDEQEAFKQKQRLNGIKGGRPKKENPTETQSISQTKANTKPKAKPKETSSYSAINSNKLEYSTDVFLSESEYQRLITENGKEFVDRCILYLSNWFQEKPFKKKETTNHNLTIRRWVISAVKEEEVKLKKINGDFKQQNNYNSTVDVPRKPIDHKSLPV